MIKIRAMKKKPLVILMEKTVVSTKARIKKAYLSLKNVDSVYEHLAYELKSKYNLDISLLYKTYTQDMMVYLFAQCMGKLQQEHLATPKKTVILLNAMVINRVTSDIVEQNKEKIKILEKARLAQKIKNKTPKKYSVNVSEIFQTKKPVQKASILITELEDEKDTNEYFLLSTHLNSDMITSSYDTENIHETRNHFQDNQVNASQKYDDEYSNIQNDEIAHNQQILWKTVVITGESQDFKTSDIELKNIVKIDLSSVNIPITLSILNNSNNTFYFSENDEPMISFKLENIDKTNVAEFLEEKLNKFGKYSYNVFLNTFTKKLCITQLSKDENDTQHQLFLLFEQTKNNCGEILGFDKRDYKAKQKYESMYPINLEDISDNFINLFVYPIRETPLLTLSIENQKCCKSRIFENFTVYESENKKENLSIMDFHIKFKNKNDELVDIGNEKYTINLKCFYFLPESKDNIENSINSSNYNEAFDKSQETQTFDKIVEKSNTSDILKNSDIETTDKLVLRRKLNNLNLE